MGGGSGQFKISTEKIAFGVEGDGSAEVRPKTAPDVDLGVGVAAGCGVV